MAQLLLFILVSVAVIIGWKILKREMSRVGETLKKTQGKDAKEIETLEKDEDGVYRPKD